MRDSGVWLHGEAVAAGMVMAADMSHRLGWIDRSIVDRTVALLKQANLPTAPPEVGVLGLQHSPCRVQYSYSCIGHGCVGSPALNEAVLKQASLHQLRQASTSSNMGCCLQRQTVNLQR